jgi:biotin transport system substrate-specific component
MKKINITRITLISLFTALIIAGTFIRLPLPPVPITLQTFFVYLASITLGPWNAMISVGLYLFLGLVGLPVFTSGGGPAALLGPTGGFLIAMLVSAPVSGLIGFASKKKPIWWLNAVALLAGTLIIYLLGTLWFMYKLPKYTLVETLGMTCFPFLIGDSVKIILSVLLAQRFRPQIQERLYPEAETEQTPVSK